MGEVAGVGLPYPIPAAFRNTGVYARGGAVQPRRFQVIGERNSGTNYLKRLIGRNTDLKPTEDLGWKHGAVTVPTIPEDLLMVISVRRADDWARSMFARPWHATAELQGLHFSDFIRAPWGSVADRAEYFPGATSEEEGRVLQADLDPGTGLPFRNLFALRRGKLAAHLSCLNRGSAVALVRMETAVRTPDVCLRLLTEALGLPSFRSPVRPVHRRLGTKFHPVVPGRPPSPAALSDADLGFLRQEVDLDLESALGFTY